MKRQTKQNVPAVLEWLDRTYGVEKETFYHKQHWQLLVAIMLSAQSTDQQVEEALPALFERFPEAKDAAKAPAEAIEEKIRSIGLYKSKAKNIKKCCTQIMEQYGGEVPADLDELVKLAGVGRKTATLFLADAYGIPGVTVDTHVFRISHRLGWADGKDPVQTERELMKVLPKEHWNRINFQLIYHGRSICTARKAKCEQCALNTLCEKRL